MGEVDVALVAQRFTSLRRHLSHRLGGDLLTMQDISVKSGIPADKVVRLERGKGSWESLLTLLLFYRNQGYNLDWILFPINESVPMLLSSGAELLRITEMVRLLSNRLQTDYNQITKELTAMGYTPLDNELSPAGTGSAEVPLTFDLS